jgi:hypothetical protein
MRSMLTIVMAVAAFAAAPALVPNSAFAHDHGKMTPRPTAVSTETASSARCECRAGGRRFVEGDETCLNGMVAVCDMEQNVTTWRMTRKVCPQS